ncbi:caffeic acid 3-O-methyltransferase-like [Punica granatum]|uniref:Caffeic acid 3-O-methyltransferase-like n=1 Tax=Punica granatum TaxID=22663 RepID=A0A6P8D7P7_PUNGR|nr:caffeic acid 3-O-methyltransferase-like [Punica granatum]
MSPSLKPLLPPSGSLSEEDEACLQAMLFSSAHVVPMVLNAATQLGLFDIINRAGPKAQLLPSQIASELETAVDCTDDDVASRLDRMLRLLASHSLLTCSVKTLEDGRVERRYGLAPSSRFFVKAESEEPSLASLVALHSHPAPQQAWFHFKDAVLEGGNQFKKVHGMSIFEYMDNDPAFNTIFNSSMVAISNLMMKRILEIYDGFEGLSSLVDVAGGTGKCLSMITSKYPSIKGINFDLPHVIKEAPSYPGIEHVGGSMFSSNIPKADAIMIKDALHNWTDEDCVKILKNCYDTLPSKGKLILIYHLLLEEPDTSISSMYASRLDNTMMMQPNGKERTESEFRALSEAAGFSNCKFVCCACNIWAVMELYKS